MISVQVQNHHIRSFPGFNIWAQIVVNNLPELITSGDLFMFADDTTIVTIQADLLLAYLFLQYNWQEHWQHHLNIKSYISFQQSLRVVNFPCRHEWSTKKVQRNGQGLALLAQLSCGQLSFLLAENDHM